uniref:uncharacterized PPE family protein PPE62-like n=1 Tax=Erigeron canadensis TaxID=72917 RepID=UPI001CB8ECEE|nr:uncharacterized PPE family protein PPE62-like [Erigeron canadensis]
MSEENRTPPGFAGESIDLNRNQGGTPITPSSVGATHASTSAQPQIDDAYVRQNYASILSTLRRLQDVGELAGRAINFYEEYDEYDGDTPLSGRRRQPNDPRSRVQRTNNQPNNAAGSQDNTQNPNNLGSNIQGQSNLGSNTQGQVNLGSNTQGQTNLGSNNQGGQNIPQGILNLGQQYNAPGYVHYTQHTNFPQYSTNSLPQYQVQGAGNLGYYNQGAFTQNPPNEGQGMNMSGYQQNSQNQFNQGFSTNTQALNMLGPQNFNQGPPTQGYGQAYGPQTNQTTPQVQAGPPPNQPQQGFQMPGQVPRAHYQIQDLNQVRITTITT